jgi:hypothetical protein
MPSAHRLAHPERRINIRAQLIAHCCHHSGNETIVDPANGLKRVWARKSMVVFQQFDGWQLVAHWSTPAFPFRVCLDLSSHGTPLLIMQRFRFQIISIPEERAGMACLDEAR